MNTSHFRQKRKQIIIPILVLVVIGIIAKALASLEKPPKKKNTEKPIPIVAIKALEVGPMHLNVQSQGFVRPKYQTDLVAQVSGEVISLSNAFVRGGVVRKGEIIARIDPSNYQATLEDAKARLASALATFELEQAQVSVAEEEWKSIDLKGTVPSALSLRKPQLKQAKAGVSAAKAALSRAKKDLSRTEIKAPYDALIESRDISIGSFASIGSRLGRVMEMSTAEVRLPTPNAQLQHIPSDGVGAKVVLSADINGVIQSWPATIVRTEGIIDSNSRMIFLVAEIVDPYQIGASELNDRSKKREPLRFGTYVSAQIQGDEILRAAKIERRFLNNGRIAVFSDGKLHFINVNLVKNEGHFSIIQGAFSEDEKLIVSALDFPVEGMPIKLSSDNSPPPEQALEQNVTEKEPNKNG